MNEPRKLGLALILLGVLVLLGNTTEALPPEAFFAGLVLYPIGGYLFFKGSREAINRAEDRVADIRAPKLRNETAEKFAQQQRSNIETHGSVEQRIRDRRQTEAQQVAASKPGRDDQELLLLETDPFEDENDFEVSSDVSFPIEIQEQDSLADQIMKLQKLHDDGIISDEEMAIAKSKLLG